MITKQELVEATLTAINNCQKTYLKWSYNEWLSFAPEYFLTVKIAEKISKINKDKYITLEDNVKKTLDISNAKGRGKISTGTRANGRYDIVIWSGGDDGRPRAIIEVKNCVRNFNKIEEDILRVCDSLNRKAANSTPTLKYGLIAFYIDNTYENDAKEKLNKQINNIFEQAKAFVLSKNLKIEFHIHKNNPFCDENNNVYASVVFLIKR